MEIFYKSLIYFVLVAVHCISVSWTLAAHIAALPNPFEACEITESDETERWNRTSSQAAINWFKLN